MMPPLAIVFADESAVGMTRVVAANAAAAEPLVLEQYPKACRSSCTGPRLRQSPWPLRLQRI